MVVTSCSLAIRILTILAAPILLLLLAIQLHTWNQSSYILLSHYTYSYHLNSIIWQSFLRIVVQGVKIRYNGLLGGAKSHYLPQSKVYDKLGKPRIHFIVQSTISMHSMLMLGRSGGMHPLGRFWKIDSLRLNLRAFHSQNTYIKCINFKKQINCEMKGSSLTINIIITCTENISYLAATYKIFDPPGNKLNDRI